MTHGKIVERGTPEELITRHNKTDLEQTFLKIVRNANRQD